MALYLSPFRLYILSSILVTVIWGRSAIRDISLTPPMGLRSAILILCESRLNVTVLANMMYALMCIMGWIIQLSFFGDLTESEIQLVKERTLNYMLFKIVFMGAILNADVHELLVWTTWFTAMCFLRAFVCLCEERFEMAAETALAGDQRDAIRYLWGVLSISFVNVGLALLCWVSFRGAGLSVLFLLFFEVIRYHQLADWLLRKLVGFMTEYRRYDKWDAHFSEIRTLHLPEKRYQHALQCGANEIR
mmetsp:Transcript_35275/g.57160  ORF Transcript_35275/g.57160 Transcript_35275/m.57160 type:complete len:248 (-) Transcript_35275:806-1549(-)